MVDQKHLLVSFLSVENEATLNHISQKLDNIQRNSIPFVPWPAYSYKPEVDFAIAYTDNNLLLKFYVCEKFVRAVYSNSNDPVYKDSCVELFISFEDGKGYYNFEFNCAGTCLLGFGKERIGRKMLSDEIISGIRRQSSLKPSGSPNANIAWELTIEIPFRVFHYHEIESLKGKRGRANVYKCGDDLPEPHFLTWNHVKTKEPDFHIPEYFGSIEFN